MESLLENINSGASLVSDLNDVLWEYDSKGDFSWNYPINFISSFASSLAYAFVVT